MVKDKPNSATAGWEPESTAYAYQGKMFSVRQDKIKVPGQERIVLWEYVEHCGAVFIVPLTADGKIILIHQYRYAIDQWCWEVPAGGLNDVKHLTPEEAAAKELQEEIGGTAAALENMGLFYSAHGIANLPSYFFLGRGVVIDENKLDREATEAIDKVQTFTMPEVDKMLIDGDIQAAGTAFALLLTQKVLAKA